MTPNENIHRPLCFRCETPRSEAKPAPVSRRKILESLEEDNGDDDPDSYGATEQASPMRRADSYEVGDDGVFSSSSSGDETTSESGSFSGSSSEEQRFSRCFLLRSLADETQSRWLLTPPPTCAGAELPCHTVWDPPPPHHIFK